MKKRLAVGGVIAVLAVSLFTLAALATSAAIHFSSDKNGQNGVTNVQEGDEIWIAVYDPDEDIDCDVRDKIWTDIKIMDPKTGAYIVWGDLNNDGEYVYGDLGDDYLEETGPSTGLFVSRRSFQIGTRVSFVDAIDGTHALPPEDFQWGNYSYREGTRGWFDCLGNFETGGVEPGAGIGDPPSPFTPQALQVQPMQVAPADFCGRFENMDALVMMYQDPNDPTDVAVGMGKIFDGGDLTTISWDQELYKDANGSAKITIIDPDENINCNKAEYVPVFIIVNPGSWNPVDDVNSSTNFCMLKRTGGVDPNDGNSAPARDMPIRWYNIYDSGIGAVTLNNDQPTSDGAYYIEYPTPGEGNVTFFETRDNRGFCRAMFYAQETAVSSGVFELNINSLLVDLGFNRLDVGDVLVAYYLDPNDSDDFQLATAYIETRERVSYTSFTSAGPSHVDVFEHWIGRDSVYVEVIDANANVDPCCPEQVVVHICDVHGEDDSEWLVLDETSSTSGIFFSNAGTQLWPAWDALGVGLQGALVGGHQLRPDNWKLEVYNEDVIYVRYNDVYYTNADKRLIGDIDPTTAFPPAIERIRVDNDVSFDMMKIGDTQVFDGSNTLPTMRFLDRQGNGLTASGYANSDCIFIEVTDPDQNEDQYRRERIDAYWDGGQNFPFGPMDFEANHEACGYNDIEEHMVNKLLGDTNIFSSGDRAQLYVLNPRNGRWAAVDLLETGVSTGTFVSVTCIDLVDVYDCAPNLAVLPNDTIIAVYMDPSNHSDSAWIPIKVGIGGGTAPAPELSEITFANAQGDSVISYDVGDDVYVKVVDLSNIGEAILVNAVEIDGLTYDLVPFGAMTDTFITDAINMDLVADTSISATYTDPTDQTDKVTAYADINIGEFVFDPVVKPNPFDTEVTFSYGTGYVDSFTVTIYDMLGHLLVELSGTSEIPWDGGVLSNGPYIYVMLVTADGETYPDRGTVFINK